MTRSTLHKRLRTARLAAGWSQTKAAEALGVTFETVSRWELSKLGIHPLRANQVARLIKLMKEETQEAKAEIESEIESMKGKS